MEGADCSELIGVTAAAIGGETMKLLLAPAQENS